MTVKANCSIVKELSNSFVAVAELRKGTGYNSRYAEIRIDELGYVDLNVVRNLREFISAVEAWIVEGKIPGIRIEEVVEEKDESK